MKRLFLFSILLASITIVTSCADAQWVEVNGKGGSVCTSFLKIGGELFAGTNDGVILSTDNGLTWSKVDNGMTYRNVNALTAIGSKLFAATDSGIFISTNNGSYWTLLVSTYPGFMKFTESFARIGTSVFASNENTLFTYRSGDSGKTWVGAGRGWPPYVYTLVASDTTLVAGTDSGVYISKDSGTDWIRIINQTIDTTTVTALGVNGTTFYAGTEYGEVFASSDDGISWHTISTTIPKQTQVSCFAFKGPTIEVGTDSGAFRSTDGGVSWEPRDSSLGNRSIITLTFSDALFLAGTNGDGVYRSVDNGKTWQPTCTGISGLYLGQLSYQGGNLIAGTGGGGVLVSSDEGIDWSVASPAWLTPDVYFLGGIDADDFWQTPKGVYRTTGHGPPWRFDSTNLSIWVNVQNMVTMGSSIFAAGFDGGIFTSKDSGLSWVGMDSGIRYKSVKYLATIGSIMIAGTYDGMYRSIDSGTFWLHDSTGLTTDVIYTLATVGSHLFAGTDSGVFVSTDSGITWTAKNNGLPPKTFVEFFGISGSNILCTTGSEIYLSTNYGESWADVSFGLPLAESYEYVDFFTFDSTYAFVVSNYNNFISSVYRRPLSEMIGSSAVAEKPPPLSELRSYPNPFTSSTTFSLSTTGGYTSVTVVNLLGQEVARLFDGELTAGEHTFEWNARNQPAGMYECIVRNGAAIQRVPIMRVR